MDSRVRLDEQQSEGLQLQSLLSLQMHSEQLAWFSMLTLKPGGEGCNILDTV